MGKWMPLFCGMCCTAVLMSVANMLFMLSSTSNALARRQSIMLARDDEETVMAFDSRRFPDHNKTMTNDHRPLFILHVGPAKTGTTTLQCYFAKYAAKLEQDDIRYLGSNGNDCQAENYANVTYPKPLNIRKYLFTDCINCVRKERRTSGTKNLTVRNSHCQCDQAWQTLEAETADAYARKQTTIMSDEMFAQYMTQDDNMENLVRILSKWRVRILYTYRRHHQVYASAYAQTHDVSWDIFKAWPNEEESGKTIESLPEYFDKNFQWRKDSLLDQYRLFTHNFPHADLRLANIHTKDPRGFVNHFVCQLIPEAQALCQWGSSSTSPTGNANNAASASKNVGAKKGEVHFDRLVTAAYQRGWISKNVTLTRQRSGLAREVQDYASKLGLQALSDFPLDCLSSDKTEILLNHAKEYKAALMPLDDTEDVELQTDFDKCLNARKFCSIDVDTTLRNPDHKWQGFFARL